MANSVDSDQTAPVHLKTWVILFQSILLKKIIIRTVLEMDLDFLDCTKINLDL